MKFIKRYLIKKLKRLGVIMYPSSEQNLKTELARYATEASAKYIRENMRGVQSVDSLLKVHDVAIKNVTIENGLVLEFGVFSGTTINHIASKKSWVVDGFDSFEGLPENWRDGFDKGHFKVSELPKVRENVRLHKGWFNESIPLYLQNFNKQNLPIAYLHIDCDLYSSTKTIFELLENLIVTGTVIVFDEYFNFDGWENDEFKAFQEFVASKNLKYEYLTYNYKHEQVSVKIL